DEWTIPKRDAEAHSSRHRQSAEDAQGRHGGVGILYERQPGRVRSRREILGGPVGDIHSHRGAEDMSKPDIIRDPRPDLAYDSREWTALLTLVTAHDKVVGGILHGFRCAGMRLNRARNGYVLEPDIGGSTWPTRA